MVTEAAMVVGYLRGGVSAGRIAVHDDGDVAVSE